MPLKANPEYPNKSIWNYRREGRDRYILSPEVHIASLSIVARDPFDVLVRPRQNAIYLGSTVDLFAFSMESPESIALP